MDRITQMEPVYGDPEREAVLEYLESGGWLTEYRETRAFEDRLAEYCGTSHASVVSNGTLSLVVALLALGVGDGDEVVVPDFTQAASAFAADLVGATPVLVDVDPETLCLDLDAAEAAMTEDTAAIVYVSLNGRSHDMREVRSLADDYGVYLVEDAAQSLGSTWDGEQLGTFGHVGSFSFSYAKIITTGQGGALVTDDDALHDEIASVRDFGRPESGVDRHVRLGVNAKFTDLQAVVGRRQMDRLPRRVERKKAMFERYEALLADVPGVETLPTDLAETPPWFVDVLVTDGRRDELAAHLDAEGIDTRPFYPPLHTQEPYRHVDGEFPVSSRVSDQGLWLPSAMTLGDDDIDRVCDAIASFMERP